MALKRIIYTSRATRGMGRVELERILHTARARNSANEITGYLLYDDGHFIQAIEGERAEVDGLTDRIRADDRHGDFQVLIEEMIEAREFGDWSMGWFHVEDVAMHDAERLQRAMVEFLEESNQGFREAIGFFRLFLRFEREST